MLLLLVKSYNCTALHCCSDNHQLHNELASKASSSGENQKIQGGEIVQIDYKNNMSA